MILLEISFSQTLIAVLILLYIYYSQKRADITSVHKKGLKKWKI